MSLHIKGNRFIDGEGRTLYFRGINLGGSSKMPSKPCGYTWRKDKLSSFFEHRTVSFVGRPFPLQEADEHFTRLRHWGFNLLRFLITWEAIEHAGPGIYDQEYLNYLYAVIHRAQDYGFYVWVDPHQDVWSRFTGGSGAPGWTLGLIGLEMRAFKESGAAIVHQTYDGDLPAMLWPTNYTKLACSTMFMLFFAGQTLAPKTLVKGENIQSFLQRHYVNSLLEVVKRLKDLECVIGYGTMNEPNMGWIGIDDLTSYDWELTLGPCCTPLQSMALGKGIPSEVQVYDRGPLGFQKSGKIWMNQGRVCAWRKGFPCVWEANGVISYTNGQAQLLRPRHFCEARGRKLDFYSDFFIPFAKLVAREIHRLQPNSFIFVEDAPFASKKVKTHLTWSRDPEEAENIVCADHWYDGITLMMKKYYSRMAWDGEGVQFGESMSQMAREKGIWSIQQHAAEHMGNVPVVIGETGIPFDLSGGVAFYTGDFEEQERALDATMRALEVCIASCTLWNYCPDNNNKYGDNWNGEDLSIFSRNQMKGDGSPYDGGRALVAAVRPHVRCYAGIALQQAFNMATKEYIFRFRCNAPRNSPNEFFLPVLQYPNGYEVNVSDGTVTRRPGQLLAWMHNDAKGDHEIRIRPRLGIVVMPQASSPTKPPPLARAASAPNPTRQTSATNFKRSNTAITVTRCRRGPGARCGNPPAKGSDFCDLHRCPSCAQEKASTSTFCNNCEAKAKQR